MIVCCFLVAHIFIICLWKPVIEIHDTPKGVGIGTTRNILGEHDTHSLCMNLNFTPFSLYAHPFDIYFCTALASGYPANDQAVRRKRSAA